MESNKKEKNIFLKIRDAYRKFMFQEEAIEKMEEIDAKPFKERLKARIESYLYIAVIIIIGGGCAIYGALNPSTKKIEDEGVYLTKKLEGETKTIDSEDFTKYMIDTINDSYIKIAQTKIGDNVAYSLVYRYDVIPEGEMTATSYFSKGYVASILINGYPNVSYEEMGLKTAEEAYLATQLAVYEYVAENQIKDMAIGEFSLDSIEPSEDEYTEMVERVVAKAKEIYSKAMETPYEEASNGEMSSDAKLELKENEAIYGPITINVTTDEITKKIMGDKYNPITEIDLKNYLEGSSAVAIDKDGNTITSIKNTETFYLKFDSTDKIFSQLKVTSNNNYLYARIYETLECDKKYVTLEPYDISYISVLTIANNMSMGNVNISFKTASEESVEEISYYIYDENDKLIQDINGFSTNYEFNLPVGKYYIKIYDTPKDYFISSKHEFEVKENETTDLSLTVDSLKDLN